MTSALLITIFIAAFLSTLLYVILKYFQRWNVYNLHGLTFNYLTASTFSFLSEYSSNVKHLNEIPGFILPALFIGMLFIVVFYVAALTAQKSGVAVTSIAGKMSMVIPIIAGVWLYGDILTSVRILGITIAIVSVVLSSVKKGEPGEQKAGSRAALLWILPVLLFIGSGLVDTCIKISQYYFINENNQELYLVFLFGSAGCMGAIASLYQYFKNGVRLKFQSVAGGILLGITNFYSLVFLIRALASPGAESSIIFALSNVMVVLISALFAIFIFREKLNPLNIAGLLMAVISIYILTF